ADTASPAPPGAAAVAPERCKILKQRKEQTDGSRQTGRRAAKKWSARAGHRFSRSPPITGPPAPRMVWPEPGVSAPHSAPGCDPRSIHCDAHAARTRRHYSTQADRTDEQRSQHGRFIDRADGEGASAGAANPRTRSAGKLFAAETAGSDQIRNRSGPGG